MKPENQRNTIRSLYNSGQTIRQIQRKLSLGYKMVHKYITDITRSSGKIIAYNVDEKAFDVLTPDTLYWIGFLLADGCILTPKKGQPLLSVKIKSSDVKHLNKLREFLKTDYPVYYSYEKSICGIKIPSRDLASRLSTYGVVPRKTTRESACKEVKDSPDFWRGVIDGDGTIYNHKHGQKTYPNLSLCGSQDICTQFQEFVKSLTGKKFRVHKLKNVNCYRISIQNAKIAHQVATVLYDGASTFLERKEAIVKSWTT